MRTALGLFYAAVFAVALTAYTALQLGWRPVVGVWDSTAALVSICVVALVTWIAAAGLGSAIPWPAEPRAFRYFPSSMGLYAAGFAVLLGLRFTSWSTAHDVATTYGLAAAFGLGLALLSALLSLVFPKTDGDPDKPPDHRALVWIICLLLIGGGGFLLFPRAPDNVHLEPAARFEQADAAMEVGLLEGGLVNHEFALLRIENGDHDDVLVCDKDEWTAVIDLWEQARKVRSAEWRLVGSVRDTVAGDQTTLTVYAGPWIRLIETSPHSPPVAYDLTAGDYDRMDKALERVRTTIGH